MKRVSLISLSVLVILLVLVGCSSKTFLNTTRSTSNTTVNATNNSRSTTIQNTELENPSSNKTNPASNGKSNAASDNKLAMEAYKEVLQNKAKFYDTDSKKNVNLNTFLTNEDLIEAKFEVSHFTVLDMDGDKVPEVVLELSIEGKEYSDFSEVLHYTKGIVYGYNFTNRGLQNLKNDGTFDYSSGAGDYGCGKLRFSANAYETDKLGYTQSNDNGHVYIVNNKSVTSESFESFFKKQNEKENAIWYKFSSENIETELSIH